MTGADLLAATAEIACPEGYRGLRGVLVVRRAVGEPALSRSLNLTTGLSPAAAARAWISDSGRGQDEH